VARNTFLEKIQRAREAAEKPVPEATEKPTEAMTDAELEEAITASKRELLDAQRAELREREIARLPPSESSPEGVRLADRLQELQRGKRRTWR